jgi:hypothetical protein
MHEKKESPRSIKNSVIATLFAVLALAGVFVLSYTVLPSVLSVTYSATVASSSGEVQAQTPTIPPLDKLAYDEKLLSLAHVATSSLWYTAFLAGTSTIMLPNSTTTVTVASKSWPVRAPYPADSRAILPNSRIVAYYGNFLSKNMGVLGQYPPEEMMARLASTSAQWEKADPTTPVIEALDYIDVVAQGSAGADGKYRARMPDSEIDKALALLKPVNGILFLDIQVGLSNLQSEVPLLEKYLQMPNVELSIDPEFAMHGKEKPGTVIGTFSSDDVNYAAQYLQNLVKQYNLPPKILVVHRFTEDMLTGYKKIKPLPEVQIVMDMDGWGDQQKKIGTYTYVVAAEPVQFTGFKLFYKNDLLPPSTGMLTPKQVLDLTPAPSYIQYQ